MEKDLRKQGVNGMPNGDSPLQDYDCIKAEVEVGDRWSTGARESMVVSEQTWEVHYRAGNKCVRMEKDLRKHGVNETLYGGLWLH